MGFIRRGRWDGRLHPVRGGHAVVTQGGSPGSVAPRAELFAAEPGRPRTQRPHRPARTVREALLARLQAMQRRLLRGSWRLLRRKTLRNLTRGGWPNPILRQGGHGNVIIVIPKMPLSLVVPIDEQRERVHERANAGRLELPLTLLPLLLLLRKIGFCCSSRSCRCFSLLPLLQGLWRNRAPPHEGLRWRTVATAPREGSRWWPRRPGSASNAKVLLSKDCANLGAVHR